MWTACFKLTWFLKRPWESFSKSFTAWTLHALQNTWCSTKLGLWPVCSVLQQSFIQFGNIKTCHWQNASQCLFVCFFYYFLLFSSLLKACWEYTLYVESWHLLTERRHWLGRHGKQSGALNREIPLSRIWGHRRTDSHEQHFHKLLLPK